MCTPVDTSTYDINYLTEVELVQGFGVTCTPGVVYRTAVLVIIEGSGVARASSVSHYNISTVVQNLKLTYREKLEAGRYNDVSSKKTLLLKIEVRQASEVNSL